MYQSHGNKTLYNFGLFHNFHLGYDLVAPQQVQNIDRLRHKALSLYMLIVSLLNYECIFYCG